MHSFLLTISLLALPYLIYPQCLPSTTNRTSSLFPGCKIEYKINPAGLCRDNLPNVIIAVHSSPQNEVRRDLIRNTYGSFKRLSNQRLLVVFVVGEVLNTTIQQNLQAEAARYNDIIQANFLDSYRNLTLKHVSLLNWVNEYCNGSSHLVKVDDDTMIDVFHLVYMIESFNFQTDFLCKAIHVPVNRDGKWKVTKEEFADAEYPDYCEGFAYLFRNFKKLPEIVRTALDTKYFWIDDVFVMGVVRKKMNLTMQYFPNNFSYTDIMQVTKIDVPNFIFFRNEANNVKRSVWYNLWNMILINSYDIFI